MRLKVILSFLAIQFVSFALWQGVHAWNKQEVSGYPAPSVVAAVSHDAAGSPSEPFSDIQFTKRFGRQDVSILDTDKKQQIESFLQKFPSRQISGLKNIVLDYDPEANRGLGGKDIIIIRAVDMDDAEFFGVMTHEIGHNVDLGSLKELSRNETSEFRDGRNPVYETDPSLAFYRISWEDEKTRKKTAGNESFVSGYAMTDPFEDFAETYAYYVLHNKDFKSKTQNSDHMLQKYEFMKNIVFNGEEFDTGEYLTTNLTRQPWDITILSYDLTAFLAG
jgi:hypothetical protein